MTPVPGMIYVRINQIMKDLGAIAKDRKNDHQGYKFRGIEDMYNAIHPILVNHQVFCVPQVMEKELQTFASGSGKTSFRVLLKISHKFYAEDGSYIDVITIGEGIDTSDKACNKAMSAAMKYAFIELLSIPTEDIEDSDKDNPEIDSLPPAKPAQAPIKPVQKKEMPPPPQAKPKPEAWENTPSDNDYVIPQKFKKYAGKRVSEVKADDLASYIAYLEKNSGGKSPSVDFLELQRQFDLVHEKLPF